MIIWLVATGFIAVLGAALALFLRQLWALARTDRPGDRNINPDRYRPLLSLLRGLDSEPPADSTTISARHQIIAVYLRSITADYGALLSQCRLVMVQSGHDRPDLARLLFRSRLQFAFAMWRIKLQLLMNRAGIAGVERLTEDVLDVVNSVRLLHRRTASLAEFAVWGA